MAKLNQEAKDYEPKQLKTVAELPFISIDMDVLEENEAQFPYKYIEADGERYKLPDTVLATIKEMLEDNPNLAKFKVKKSGEGLKTKYTTIPLTQ